MSVDDFVRRFAFEAKGKMVSVRNLKLQTEAVDLKLGQLYTCEIDKVKYQAFLTNIEFKNKMFFSVTVDLYKQGKIDALFKSNVYFYNPPVIFDRASRFPLHKDTISNNVAFWSTLEHANDHDLISQHSEVQFLRMALQNSPDSKDCRMNIRETRKKSQTVFSKLDAIKNKRTLPTIRMESTITGSDKTVTIYGIQKNKPMEKLLQLHRGDQIKTKFNHDGPEYIATVLDITRFSLVVEWEVKTEGLKRNREIFFKKFTDPFWKNLKKLSEQSKSGSKTDESTEEDTIGDFYSRVHSEGRKTVRRRRPTPWPRQP